VALLEVLPERARASPPVPDAAALEARRALRLAGSQWVQASVRASPLRVAELAPPPVDDSPDELEWVQVAPLAVLVRDGLAAARVRGSEWAQAAVPERRARAGWALPGLVRDAPLEWAEWPDASPVVPGDLPRVVPARLPEGGRWWAWPSWPEALPSRRDVPAWVDATGPTDSWPAAGRDARPEPVAAWRTALEVEAEFSSRPPDDWQLPPEARPHDLRLRPSIPSRFRGWEPRQRAR